MMFNRKRIKSLEKEISSLKEDVERINTRLWELQNPAKYKKGETVRVKKHYQGYGEPVMVEYDGIIISMKTDTSFPTLSYDYEIFRLDRKFKDWVAEYNIKGKVKDA